MGRRYLIADIPNRSLEKIREKIYIDGNVSYNFNHRKVTFVVPRKEDAMLFGDWLQTVLSFVDRPSGPKPEGSLTLMDEMGDEIKAVFVGAFPTEVNHIEGAYFVVTLSFSHIDRDLSPPAFGTFIPTVTFPAPPTLRERGAALYRRLFSGLFEKKPEVSDPKIDPSHEVYEPAPEAPVPDFNALAAEEWDAEFARLSGSAP